MAQPDAPLERLAECCDEVILHYRADIGWRVTFYDYGAVREFGSARLNEVEDMIADFLDFGERLRWAE